MLQITNLSRTLRDRTYGCKLPACAAASAGRQIKRRVVVLVLIMLLGTMLVSNFVYAETSEAEKDAAAIKKAMNKIDEVLPSETVKNANVNTLVGNALSVGMGIIGSISLIVFLYSGIMWMTSGGDATKVGKAQGSMIWGALGLFVIFISYIIVKYLIEGFSLWQG